MNKVLRRTIPFLLTLLLIGWLLRRGIQWNQLVALLQNAHWGWLLLGIFWQACAFLSVTWLNELLLQRYGARVPFGRQYLIQLAMAFIETVVPTASISGIVLRVRLLKPHAVSTDVATVTTMAEMTLVTASLILLAVPLVGIALWNGSIKAVEFNPVTVILFCVSLIVMTIILSWRSPRAVQIRENFTQLISRIWDDRIRTRWLQSLAPWTSQRLLERLRYLKVELTSVLRDRPFAISLSLLARSGFEALGLMMCFFGLGQFLPFQTMLLIYVLTIAVNTLGGIPGGVGLAEVSLITLYAQFGISAETALTIALAYRLTGYWLPRLFGGIAWLWLEGKYHPHILEAAS